MLPALLLLLSAAYIGINFVGLPLLLVVENILLAAFYAVVAIGLWKKPSRTLYALLATVAAFNAGRVSRTIWSPTEGLGRLAVEHIPLFLYLLVISALAFRELIRK
ncbi:MAG: hypothetical protein QXT46_02340 [Pyrobaculum sp.]